MSLTSLAIRFAAPLPDIEAFERYLFIGPHPDDIEIGAGATAAKLAAAGKKVCFLVCLDGRFGLENAPAGTSPDDLAALRTEEAKRSARMLGVDVTSILHAVGRREKNPRNESKYKLVWVSDQDDD